MKFRVVAEVLSETQWIPIYIWYDADNIAFQYKIKIKYITAVE